MPEYCHPEPDRNRCGWCWLDPEILATLTDPVCPRKDPWLLQTPQSLTTVSITTPEPSSC